MGGTQSRFDETNWDTADGGLRLGADTVDGSKPTSRYSVITLIERARLEYDVHDHRGKLLFTTKPIQLYRFYLLGKGGERLLRIQGEVAGWKIYSFGKPSFVGQRPARDMFGDICYRRAKIKIHGRRILCYKYCRSREGRTDMTGVTQYDSPILQVQDVTTRREKCQSSGSKESDGPLVGYWEWEKQISAGDPTVKLHLAKGADVALHCAFVVMLHMIRMERSSSSNEGADLTTMMMTPAPMMETSIPCNGFE